MEISIEQLSARLEALLFSEGEPVSMKRLSSLLHCDNVSLLKALEMLAEHLKDRGVTLVRTETEAALAIASIAEETVKKAQEAEIKGDIGDAGLEVLAILLYRGASTRADIDYIRGVNSTFSIRTLLIRGLVERIKNPTDSREFLYRPTVELLAHLGAREGKELPDYATIRTELAAFETAREPEHNGTRNTENST